MNIFFYYFTKYVRKHISVDFFTTFAWKNAAY